MILFVVFTCLFQRAAVFYIPSILFFSCDMLQSNSVETMQPAGPLNQGPGWARPEPDVALEMLIMFVLFTNTAQSRFLIFWPLSPLLPLSRVPLIYIHTGSPCDINCKQRGFWFCHILKTVFVGTCRSGRGGGVYGDACVRRLFTLEKKYNGKLWVAGESKEMTWFPIMSFWGRWKKRSDLLTKSSSTWTSLSLHNTSISTLLES